MAEIQPPEGQINGGGTLILNSSEPSIGSKRQRPPSVRLGDIGGDQPYDSHARRNSKPWKLAFDGGHHHHHHRGGGKEKGPGKPSKTRPLTNLSEIDEGGDNGGGSGGGGGEGEEEEKYNGDGDDDDDDVDGYREFEVENSESPLKEQSPIHKNSSSNSMTGLSYLCRLILMGGEDGVRIWLNGLGLGRYAPVFEVHEVDDEVLPMLTLEDLKDMGISAVGSRRKMYTAIQKLGKGFS
uniref:Protein bicaudal C isogeny 1 n=1 Tax=Cajanus cajan TaxID=3821 RepID=A0A151RRG4_CAJCA|nr:Protein bicaudal C isogeny 1 [Cajanus cajan]